MSSRIESLLQRRGGVDPATADQYLTNRLAQFNDSAFLVASFPPGTALDTAMAAVRYHDSQSTDDHSPCCAWRRGTAILRLPKC